MVGENSMDNLLNEYITQKQLLVEAIVEKDYMQIYESFSLKNDFVLKLGEPRYKLHKIEITIARTKLKLDMLETCIKLKVPIDIEQIDKHLDKEFEKHDSMLKSMKKEIDSVHNLDNEDLFLISNVKELKKVYFSIACYVHPELSDSADKNAKRIWKAAKKAYENGDVAKLKRLQKKVQNEYRDILPNEGNPKTDLENMVSSMKSKREEVLSEIERLKKQFPFNEAKMLGDQDAIIKFKKDIDLDIKVAKELLDKLEKQVLEKLPAPSRFLN